MRHNIFHVEDVVVGGGVITPFIDDALSYTIEAETVLDYLNAFEITKEEIFGKSDVEEALYDFIANEGISLLMSLNTNCETFFSTRNKYTGIAFKPDSLTSDKSLYRLMALSHELGHYLDYKWNFNFDEEAFVEHSKNGKELYSEITAWVYAEDVLEALGFEEWEDFYNLKFNSLLTYACNDEAGLLQYLSLEEKIVERREKQVVEQSCYYEMEDDEL